ncbi:alpha/beta fold hydrolase [Nonomuraea thailandensis]
MSRPSGSVLDDPAEDATPELRADDLAAILDDLGAESADVFGSSGGAVTGPALVARRPGRVRTLVAGPPRRSRSSPTAPGSSRTSCAAPPATCPTSPRCGTAGSSWGSGRSRGSS